MSKHPDFVDQRFKVIWLGKQEDGIRYFYFTNEPYNSWRCGECATKSQRDEIRKEMTVNEIKQMNSPKQTPICCRVCKALFDEKTSSG